MSSVGRDCGERMDRSEGELHRKSLCTFPRPQLALRVPRPARLQLQTTRMVSTCWRNRLHLMNSVLSKVYMLFASLWLENLNFAPWIRSGWSTVIPNTPSAVSSKIACRISCIGLSYVLAGSGYRRLLGTCVSHSQG